MVYIICVLHEPITVEGRLGMEEVEKKDDCCKSLWQHLHELIMYI